MSEKKNKIKVAPNSKESEMMVLGCMLTSINSLNIASDALDDGDFYFPEHKILFQVLKEAYKKDKPADVHLVCEELKRVDKLDAVGGAAYIATVAQYAGTSAFIEEYGQIVKTKSILRKMIQAAQTVEKTALEEPTDVYAALDEAQQLFFKISQTSSPGAGVLINDLLSGVKSFSQKPYIKELQERQELYSTLGPGDAKITGLPTHFLDLDKLLNGLNNSNLIILAARPAMGKTAFALNIAENVCFKNNAPVGIFSLEMTAEQLLHRIICSQAEVESDHIRTGSLSGMEFQRIVSCVGHMQNFTMVIDDQPGLKITDLRARARRMKESYGIKLLIIDYLQLISGSGLSKTSDNRQNEISEISRMLKTLARELNIPVICLSQLSRKVEDRTGHRPMMSDLRESGCLAGETLIQDADTGQFWTIKELAERKKQTPIRVWGVDESLTLAPRTMSKAFYSGKKVVYELKTQTGRIIKASSNHPFLKWEGWTRLDQLQAGDLIALPGKRYNTTTAMNRKQMHSNLFSPAAPPSKKRFSPSGSFAATLGFIYPAQMKKKGFSSLLSPAPIGVLRSHLQEKEYGLYPCGQEPKKQQDALVEKFHWLMGHAVSLDLGRSDVFWDEIVSIKKLGVEDVYDATVEEVHNFVANGIIVHNSIEQDSDIVMFLLRREYYDPNDKPGMAEVIVAKNRHGAVGSVNLTFIKELAQFRNYTPLRMDSDRDSFADL